MTVGSGKNATTDNLTLDAVLESPLVELHTRARDENKRPAIQVGDQIYPAPFMRLVANVGTYAEPNAGAPRYQALFQALVLNRRTLEKEANRTYGWCISADNAREYTCRKNNAGEPVEVPMGQELESDGADSLVIVNSLPATTSSASVESGYVDSLLVDVALDNLPAIGFPQRSNAGFVDRLFASGVGNISVIGVPGLPGGEAKLALERGMDGFLLPDQNKPQHYGFVPSARVPFDTRSTPDPICNANECTVAIAVGSDTQVYSEQVGGGGFLVSVYLRSSLTQITQGYFRTNGGSPEVATSEVEKMASFLQTYGYNGGQVGSEANLVVITSVHGPQLNPPLLYGSTANAWEGLAKQVAALGGTLHRFNTAASTPNSDYTLVGFGGAGEGHGDEAMGPNARIRGVLVPDRESNFAPMNATSGGTTGEVFAQILTQPPGENWEVTLPDGTKATGAPWWPIGTSDDSAGTRAAIAFVGGQVSELSSDPRHAYWVNSTNITSDTSTDVAAAKLTNPDTGEVCSCTQPELDKAKEQLLLELRYVRRARTYLGNLAYPSGETGADAWSETKTVAGKLIEDRDFLNDEAETVVEGIEGAFGFVAAFLDLSGELSAGTKFGEKLEKFFLTSAAALEIGAEYADIPWNGSSGADELRVVADEVGTQLQEQARAASGSFKTMGDVVVSDWGKLKVIGRYGGCDPPPDKNGCPPGLEELAFTDAMQDDATSATNLVQRRSVYQHLIPYSYPVFNTGLTYSCNTIYVTCSPDTGPSQTATPQQFAYPLAGGGCGTGDPFGNAVKGSFFSALERLNPGKNVWRVWMSIGRKNLSWGWADEDVYSTMFDDVNPTDLDHSPLQIEEIDFMMHANERIPNVPTQACHWENAP